MFLSLVFYQEGELVLARKLLPSESRFTLTLVFMGLKNAVSNIEHACFLCSCRVPHDTVLNSGKLSLLKWVNGELTYALNFAM